MNPQLLTTLGVAVLALVLFEIVLINVYRALYRKVGPNEVLVLSGGKGETILGENGERRRIGFRIVRGGGTLVNPLTERMEIMPMPLLALDLSLPNVTDREGARLGVEGVAQARFAAEDAALRRAVTLFLGRPAEEIEQAMRRAVEGRLCTLVGSLTRREIAAMGETFACKAEEAAARDLWKMGMEFVSFSLRPVAVAPHEQPQETVGVVRSPESEGR